MSADGCQGDMEPPISLNAVKMRVVSTAEGGEVNSETLFEFAGGRPVSGRSWGTALGYWWLDGHECFAFVMLKWPRWALDGGF